MGLAPTLRSLLVSPWAVAAELQQKVREDQPHKLLQKGRAHMEPGVETSRALVPLA